MKTFRWRVAAASLACLPVWVEACDLPEGIAPDAPTLYYVNGANGSPVITAVNVAVLAEISQIAVLVIFYAGDGAAVAIDALPAVSSGPAVEILERVIADGLARQKPVHIRGVSAG